MSKLEYDDPVYRHTRREAASILVLWGLCLGWVVPYCCLFGYQNRDSSSLVTVLGLPSWVFWGVGVPWVVSSLAGIAMCLWWIQEDDLGEAEHLTASENSSACAEDRS